MSQQEKHISEIIGQFRLPTTPSTPTTTTTTTLPPPHHHTITVKPQDQSPPKMTKNITIGVLALQGGVVEHLNLLRRAADHILTSPTSDATTSEFTFDFAEVRTAPQLAVCDALIIPGGESTTMAIVARRLGLLDPLRDFVKSVSLPCF